MLFKTPDQIALQNFFVAPKVINGGFLHRTMARVTLWAARHRQRAALARHLECPHILDDLGITREEALHEIAKPFWEQ